MLPGSQALVNDPYYNDVVLHLRGYDAQSGQVFKDYSKYNRTITANGNVAHSTTQKKYGNSSIYFDGSGDYLSLPSLSLISTDFVINCWIFLNSVNTNQVIATSYNGIPFQPNSCLLYINSLGNVGFSNGLGGVISTTTLVANTWYFISAKYINSIFNSSLYINGVNEGTASIPITNEAPLFYIGGSPNDNNIGGWWLNGYISKLLITKNIARPIAVPAQPFPNW